MFGAPAASRRIIAYACIYLYMLVVEAMQNEPTCHASDPHRAQAATDLGSPISCARICVRGGIPIVDRCSFRECPNRRKPEMNANKHTVARSGVGGLCHCTALRKASRRISQLYDTAL